MIKFLDKSNNQIQSVQDFVTAVYQEEIEPVFLNWDSSQNLKNIVPNTKYLHEDKTKYITNIDELTFELKFQNQKVTEVSSLIRDRLNKLDLTQQFGDLSKYIVLIGTELVQNALIAGDKPDNIITLKLYINEDSFKLTCHDSLGTLTRDKVMTKLQRAYKEKSFEEKKEGAGLGLYMVVNSCDRIIFDLQQKNETTICCIIKKYKRLKEFKKRKAIAIHFLEVN